MLCSRCGAKNADKNTYCRYCGALLEQEQPPAEPEPAQAALPPLPEGPVEQVTPQVLPSGGKPKIQPFTLFAYRLLSSKEKYRNLFLLLALSAVSLAAAALLGMSLPSLLTAAMQKSETAMQDSFQEWRMVWSAVLLLLGFVGVLAGCAVTGYKMLKIRRVFQEKGRKMEPLPKGEGLFKK